MNFAGWRQCAFNFTSHTTSLLFISLALAIALIIVLKLSKRGHPVNKKIRTENWIYCTFALVLVAYSLLSMLLTRPDYDCGDSYGKYGWFLVFINSIASLGILISMFSLKAIKHVPIDFSKVKPIRDFRSDKFK